MTSISLPRRLALGLALIATACSHSPNQPAASLLPQPTPSQPTLAACPSSGSSTDLPTATLTCLTDGKGKLMSTRLGNGTPLLVNLWASWCGPCRKEMPALQRAYATASGRIGFLGVDTEDDPNSARDFLAHVGVHYPQVSDDEGILLRKLGGIGLPVTVVLDATGKRVYTHRGELRPTDLTAALRSAGVALPRVSPS